ncbi:MAG TPA: DNA double-strand break repair nuclease NurA [Chloroflexota bacterium]|nr:DNA double-strand break repair nuclease NurA [Chloroflexota bacterium]
MGIDQSNHGEGEFFGDLPAALVNQMLEESTEVGRTLAAEFNRLSNHRGERRRDLENEGLLLSEGTLPYEPLPTVCAADGAYGVDRLLAIDLVVAAAVAVEGLTPPSETRYWDETRHELYMHTEVHLMDTSTVLRALMLGMELLLAAHAPHDLVLMDGTLTLPVIYFNQALSLAPRRPELQCAQRFLERCPDFLNAYAEVLLSPRNDRSYCGLAKYSTRREIGHRLGWPGEYDDRGMLSMVLRPGELTQPVVLEPPESAWHLTISGLSRDVTPSVEPTVSRILTALSRVHVVYYRPFDWMPALRLELAEEVARNRNRLAVVIQGIKHQCAAPGMLEPYPQYMADRMAKSVGKAMRAFRQIATHEVAEAYAGDLGDVFMALHGYRSESGRE